MFEISGYRKAYRVDNIFMKNFLIILVVALFTISCQKQTTLQPEFQANETIKINSTIIGLDLNIIYFLELLNKLISQKYYILLLF